MSSKVAAYSTISSQYCLNLQLLACQADVSIALVVTMARRGCWSPPPMYMNAACHAARCCVLQGEAGPAGGPVGPTGAKGEKGDRGPTGAQVRLHCMMRVTSL
jgi:hypothetical protein